MRGSLSRLVLFSFFASLSFTLASAYRKEVFANYTNSEDDRNLPNAKNPAQFQLTTPINPAPFYLISVSTFILNTVERRVADGYFEVVINARCVTLGSNSTGRLLMKESISSNWNGVLTVPQSGCDFASIVFSLSGNLVATFNASYTSLKESDFVLYQAGESFNDTTLIKVANPGLILNGDYLGGACYQEYSPDCAPQAFVYLALEPQIELYYNFDDTSRNFIVIDRSATNFTLQAQYTMVYIKDMDNFVLITQDNPIISFNLNNPNFIELNKAYYGNTVSVITDPQIKTVTSLGETFAANVSVLFRVQLGYPLNTVNFAIQTDIDCLSSSCDIPQNSVGVTQGYSRYYYVNPNQEFRIRANSLRAKSFIVGTDGIQLSLTLKQGPPGTVLIFVFQQQGLYQAICNNTIDDQSNICGDKYGVRWIHSNPGDTYSLYSNWLDSDYQVDISLTPFPLSFNYSLSDDFTYFEPAPYYSFQSVDSPYINIDDVLYQSVNGSFFYNLTSSGFFAKKAFLVEASYNVPITTAPSSVLRFPKTLLSRIGVDKYEMTLASYKTNYDQDFTEYDIFDMNLDIGIEDYYMEKELIVLTKLANIKRQVEGQFIIWTPIFNNTPSEISDEPTLAPTTPGSDLNAVIREIISGPTFNYSLIYLNLANYFNRTSESQITLVDTNYTITAQNLLVGSQVNLSIEGIGSASIPSSLIEGYNQERTQGNLSVASVVVLQTIDKLSASLISQNFSVGGSVIGLNILDSAGNVIELSNSFNYSITLMIKRLSKENGTQCAYWNEIDNVWTFDGIVGGNSTDDQLECIFTHLTNFTIGSQSKEQPQSSLIKGFPDGALVGILIGGIVILAILVIVWFVLSKKRRYSQEIANMSDVGLVMTEIKIERKLPGMDLVIEDEIGRGAFGTVYRALQGGTTVLAVKVYNKGYDKDMFVKETEIMKSLRFPNVVQFLGATEDDEGRYNLVMEYISGGTLLDVLRSKKNNKLTDKQKIEISMGIAAALNYLQELNIVHCDVSARNILMREDKTPKLADFGMAFRSDNPIPPSNDPAVRWSAPEVLSKKQYSHASDVWSFAVVITEIFGNGAIPYYGSSNEEVVILVKKGSKLDPPTGVSIDVSKLLNQCWSFDPKDRPNFSRISSVLKEEKNQFPTEEDEQMNMVSNRQSITNFLNTNAYRASMNTYDN